MIKMTLNCVLNLRLVILIIFYGIIIETCMVQCQPTSSSSSVSLTSSSISKLTSRTKRIKRAAYEFPANASEINLGKKFKKTFKCEKDKDGYFADIDNDCKVFHQCRTAKNAGKRTEVQHYSFICNKGLVFDQSTFTCTREEDAIPCDASPMFYDLNERIGSDGPFLTDADIERAKAARPQYRRRRRRRHHHHHHKHHKFNDDQMDVDDQTTTSKKTRSRSRRSHKHHYNKHKKQHHTNQIKKNRSRRSHRHHHGGHNNKHRGNGHHRGHNNKHGGNTTAHKNMPMMMMVNATASDVAGAGCNASSK